MYISTKFPTVIPSFFAVSRSFFCRTNAAVHKGNCFLVCLPCIDLPKGKGIKVSALMASKKCSWKSAD